MSYAHIYVIPDQGDMKGGLLFDKYANLAYFAVVDALEDKTQTQRDLQVSVKSHARKKFLGDPSPGTVKASTRNVSMGIRRTKGAVPGYKITLDDGLEKRVFQYTGTMSCLYAWLKDTAARPIDLFGPTGTPYDQVPTAAGASAPVNAG